MCAECDEYGDEFETPAAKLNWADVAYAALCPLEGLWAGMMKGVQTMQGVLAGHSAHLAEKQSFQREAGMEIERLTNGGTDG